MTKKRLERVSETIKHEISDIIQREIKDPRISLVTVTSVKVSPDLRHAIVFVSILGSDEKGKASLEGLRNAKGFIKSELGKRIRIKFLPDLKFKLDEKIDESIRISKLIQKILPSEERDKDEKK